MTSLTEKIREFLKGLKPRVFLRDRECFDPSDHHIVLSLCRKKGYDPVSYVEYDPEKQTVRGINPFLVEKLCYFMRVSENYDLIQEVKENLE